MKKLLSLLITILVMFSAFGAEVKNKKNIMTDIFITSGYVKIQNRNLYDGNNFCTDYNLQSIGSGFDVKWPKSPIGLYIRFYPLLVYHSYTRTDTEYTRSGLLAYGSGDLNFQIDTGIFYPLYFNKFLNMNFAVALSAINLFASDSRNPPLKLYDDMQGLGIVTDVSVKAAFGWAMAMAGVKAAIYPLTSSTCVDTTYYDESMDNFNTFGYGFSPYLAIGINKTF